MAWIKVEQSLPSHRKALLGSQLANMDRYKYVGHLIAFWTWALDHTDDDGKLPGLPDDVLGEMAGLTKKQGRVFIESMKETHLLDVTECGYVLHNWEKYAGRLLDKRRKDAGRKADERERKGVTNNGHSADKGVTKA